MKIMKLCPTCGRYFMGFEEQYECGVCLDTNPGSINYY